jgi:CubicO group peptidase (beta-lactamase class C family)
MKRLRTTTTLGGPECSGSSNLSFSRAEVIHHTSRIGSFLVLGALTVGSFEAARRLWAQGPLLQEIESVTSELENVIPGLMKKGGVPGMSIALVRDRKTAWLHGFGVKDKKTGEPVTVDTVFEAASLSKPVFAYAVLPLVDQGKLDLDAPLSTYLPRPYVQDPRASKITARMVLSHRTGFPNWRESDGLLPIYFPPGKRFSYSGEGYIYLQRVVEQITGKPLDLYMDEAVFRPLGMTNSSYVWRPSFDALTATGYDSKGVADDLWKPKEAGAASSLNTTARDYALFVAALLSGKGISASTLREMETPQVALDPSCRICIKQEPRELSKTLFWGLGWGIQMEHGRAMLWHWGDNGAFKAFVMADPVKKSGVVMFANGEDALNIAKPIIDTALDTDAAAFVWLK